MRIKMHIVFLSIARSTFGLSVDASKWFFKKVLKEVVSISSGYERHAFSEDVKLFECNIVSLDKLTVFNFLENA